MKDSGPPPRAQLFMGVPAISVPRRTINDEGGEADPDLASVDRVYRSWSRIALCEQTPTLLHARRVAGVSSAGPPFESSSRAQALE